MEKPELRPLSAAESAEFERRRISDAVVQTKCEACGAWYETRRLGHAFKEAFDCDCGARLEFMVPAMPDSLIRPSNEAIIAAGDPDQRLDTGMKVSEALTRARRWWENTGRKLARRELLRQSKPVGSSDKGAGTPFATLDSADLNFLPSGLIHGREWDSLTKREKSLIVKAWHHFFIRKPDLIGGPEAKHKFQDRGLIQ